MALNPEVKWSELDDRVFITFEIQDVKSPDISILNKDGNGLVTFRGKTEAGQEYSCDLSLSGPVKEDGNKIARTDRHVSLMVLKEQEGRWGRLVQGKAPTFVKVDWDRWVDSDEEEEGGDMGGSGFDMSQFDNFKNWGDDAGDAGDSDDEVPGPGGDAGAPAEEAEEAEDVE